MPRMAVWFERMPPTDNTIRSRTPPQYLVDAFACRNSSPDTNYVFFGFSFADHTPREFESVKANVNSRLLSRVAPVVHAPIFSWTYRRHPLLRRRRRILVHGLEALLIL